MTTFSPILLLWYIFPLIVLLVAQIIVKLLSLTKRFQLKERVLAGHLMS
jgi:positive regulator of sigma E activity